MLIWHFKLEEKTTCLDKEHEVENEETGCTGPEDLIQRTPRDKSRQVGWDQETKLRHG